MSVRNGCVVRRRSAAYRRLVLLAICMVSVFSASCTRVEIEDHSLQFNQAAGSLGNRLLLLNAVRAAQGYPLQFSRLTSYTGQSRLDGNIGLSLPFVANTFGSPPDGRFQGTVTPGASFKTGVSNLQLTDLNTAEIQQKLREQVKASDFAYYRSQGWQKALVNTILIESISVDPKLYDRLKKASDVACRGTGRANNRQACAWLRSEIVAACFRKRAAMEERASRDGDTVLVYTNNPRKICQHVGFQWVFTSIRVLAGTSLDLDPRVDTDECKTTRALMNDVMSEPTEAKGKKGKGEKDSFEQTVKDGKISVDVNVKVGDKQQRDDDDRSKDQGGVIGLVIPKGARAGRVNDLEELSALDQLRSEQLCILKEKRKPIDILYRSPERMVRYLGEVVAVQSFGGGDASGPIQILSDDGDPAELFRVERGGRTFAKSAISVEGPEGENFSIPTTHGKESRHLSMQALALVMESFNLAVSGKALPQPTTIFLSPG